MPIETRCPHCRKGYQLRDEFAGKRVKCANTLCQKPFLVQPGTGGDTWNATQQSPDVASPAVRPSSHQAAPSPSQPASVAPIRDEEPSAEAKKTSPPAEFKKPKPAVGGGTEPGVGKKAGKPKPLQKPFESSGLPVSPEDAEALAASFFDEEAASADVSEDVRVVDMTCAMCDHKWTEPHAKIGKQVLCPECRHRQRVPDQKKAKAIDWRDPNANRPSLAKGEELPEDLRQQQTRSVAIDSLEQAGAIEEPLVEPRPFRQKLTFALSGIGILLAVTVAVLFVFRNRTDNREQQSMQAALNDLPEFANEKLPKGQGPLFRGLLSLSAGEYAIRTNLKPRREEALRQFTAARAQFEEASPGAASLERDILLGEVTLGMLELGGNDEQVLSEIRFRWTPQSITNNRPRMTGDMTTVQAEVRRGLASMRKENQEAEFDVRVSVVRRLAVQLNAAGQYEWFEEMLGQGFSEAELPEATAQVALELHRLPGGQDRARRLADRLRDTMATSPTAPVPLPISAQVLWQVVEPPTKGTRPVVGPIGPGENSAAARNAALLLAACKDDAAKMTEVAALSAPPAQTLDRMRGFALAAGYCRDPKPILLAAAELLSKDPRPEAWQPAQSALLRLALIASRAKEMERAGIFAARIADPGTKAWANAELLRARLANQPDQKFTATPDLPEDANTLRIGHAWGCRAVARHNAFVTGDASVQKQYADWPKSLITFAKAGLALGLQDRHDK